MLDDARNMCYYDSKRYVFLVCTIRLHYPDTRCLPCWQDNQPRIVAHNLDPHRFSYQYTQPITTAPTLPACVPAPRSHSLHSHLADSFTSYDMLTRGAGPACLLLVVLSRALRAEPSVAVKPAAAAAFAALLLEPLFTAFVLGSAPTVGGAPRVLGILPRRFRGRNRTAAAAAASAAATAVARARWLTAGAQLALWVAVVLAYAQVSLRLSMSSAGSRRTLAGYLTALRTLASKKRGTGGWARVNQSGLGGGAAPSTPGGGGAWAGEEGQTRARTHSLIGSLYEKLASGIGGGGSGTDQTEVRLKLAAS